MPTTLDQIKHVYVEATSYCNLHCPQCPRHDQDGYLMRGLTLEHLDPDAFRRNLELDRMTALRRITLLGDHGDIMMHPRARDWLEIGQGHIRIEAVTNGGMRDPRWWCGLANIPNLLVVFSIDGLEDTHSIYRINSDWQRTIDNARAFIDAGGCAEWNYVVFRHNEHQVETARALSQELGFQDFHVTHTARNWWNGQSWPVKVEGQYLYDIHPSSQVNWVPKPSHKQAVIKIQQGDVADIAPNCWLNHNKIYVNYLGHVVPCSMTSAMTWRPDIESAMWRRLVGDLDTINLMHHSLSEILASDFYQHRLAQSWQGTPYTHSACISHCTDTSRLGRARCSVDDLPSAIQP